jgi:glycerate 2-kinase
MRTWVSNRDIFSTSKIRQDALAILEVGLSAIETELVLKEEVTLDKANQVLHIKNLSYHLSNFNNLYLVAIGKCAYTSSKALEEILGDEITDGVVLDIQDGQSERLKIRKGTHPMPSEENVSATEEIIELLERVTENDLVIMIVSGGGSALLSSPYKIDYNALSSITKSLMDKGANIEEINTVRKHLSNVSGGQLAKIAYPSTVVGLLFSDVIGDDISIIASGPLTKDSTTTTDARNILEKYDVLNICSLPDCELKETPKDDKYFDKVENLIMVNGERALLSMKKEAEKLGYQAIIETMALRGEARERGGELALKNIKPNTVIFWAGETTVNVINPRGEGGRNLEFALGALATDTFSKSNSLVVSIASDGRDNCEFAGAIADVLSDEHMKELNLNPKEFLDNNDSKNFWASVGSGILTGATGINVADFAFVLRGEDN